ncbi:unnamed protein product [Trichobilharzia regenti]|nr:unnamed protein product [Trichobilharzia regenti]VDQ10658.1 unnamed protein product [Trichobilharzia regenti]
MQLVDFLTIQKKVKAVLLPYSKKRHQRNWKES